MRSRRSHLVRASALVSISLGLSSSSLFAQDIYTGPFPTTGAGENTWGNPANWSGGAVPNAVDAHALFLNTLGGEVEVDGVYTLGKLESFIPGGLTMPTKPTSFDPAKGFTLATSSGQPEISAGAANGTIWLYHSIFGTQGYRKTGPGVATFRFNGTAQTYTGDVRIEGGTLGINQDSSLGAASNNLFIGAVDGLSPNATLLVAPGSNSGTVTLLASRTINLIGAEARIDVNNAAVTTVVEGNITDNGGGFGFTKIGPGTLVLNGANTYGGNTTVSAGSLIAPRASALPGYDQPGRVAATGTGSVVARMGGVGEWTTAEFNTLAASASLGNDAGLGVDTTNAAAAVEIAGLTAGQNFNLSKLGVGTLRLTGANNWTGTSKLRLFNGTLEVGPTGSLPSGLNLIFLNTGTQVASLDLGGGTLPISNFTEAPASPVVVTNGSVSINTDVQLDFQGNNGMSVDLSGLSSFTQERSNRGMRVLPASIANAANAPGTVIEVKLAQNSTFKVNNVQIGGAAGTSQGFNHEGRLVLGSGVNTFNITRLETVGGVPNTDTSVFQVGGFNGSGRVSFPTGSTTGSLVLRAFDGTSPLTFWRIGETSSGVRNGGGIVDLSGGSVDAIVGDLTLSRHIAASANSETSTLTVAAGTITANRLVLGQKVNGGANPPSPTFNDPYLTATLNLNGGVINASTILIGEALQGTNAGVPNPGATNYIVNVNLNGGELRAGAVGNNTGTHAAAYDEAETVRNFNLGGGTLTHLAGQDLLIDGGNDLDANPDTTGNLVSIRATAGGGAVRADAGRVVTLGANTRILSVPPAAPEDPQPVHTLGKTGEGDLVVNGAIAETVQIKVDAGRLVVDNGATPALLDINATVLIEDATVAGVLPLLASGYNGGTWDGVGYTSSAAAASTSPKLGIGYTQEESSVLLKLAKAADTDLDGAVNFTDLLTLAQNYGLSDTTWGTGDFDYNGSTEFADLLTLAQNYEGGALNSVISGSSAQFQSDWSMAQSLVPEPTTLGLAGALAVLLGRRHR
jgi:autotransporter-associated beta strand protein